MQCKKCGQIISEDNKFCNNCGSRIEKDFISGFNDTMDHHSNIWFMAGYLRGILSKNKKLLEKFENIIKEDPEIWDKYQRTFNYMINFIHENGKEKEAIRPKQKSISETKTMQKE